MPMPSVTDLQTMYGDWNPQAYLQAQGNADLERQYRESEYGRQQQLTKQAGLESAFQEQNNPLKIEQRKLENQNLGYTGVGQQATNRKLGVEADIAEQTKQYKLNDAQRKELLAVDENDLKMADQEIERLRRSLDPADQARGQKLFEFTGYARAEKAKHEQALALQRMKEEGDTKRTGMSNATQIKTTQMGIDAGKYTRGGTAKTVEARLADAKNPVQKAEILESAYYEAMAAGDAPAAQVYQQRAIEARQRAAEGAANAGLAKPGTTIEGGKIVGTPRPSADAPIAGSTSGGNKPAQRKPLSQY